MPRNYERKTLRASWSDGDLNEAMQKVSNKEMGVNEASRAYNIPSRTLRRHMLTGKPKVPLGRPPVFSQEHEKKLVAHIKKLEKVGFAPDRKDVKEMAFQLAQKLSIKNPFSKDTQQAGNIWFNWFLKRNPELSQRKSEGLSLARAYGVNREDVNDFFTLLAQVYEDNDLGHHPDQIFNMDETGIQINNKPGKVIASKGAKDVYTLTSCEKGENVTVIACCNAQGNFMPPVLIYKGTYSKPQFSEGLPPGSQIFMNKKSSYINSELFMKWFEEIFLQNKSPGKALLILDGHSAHSNNIRLLEVAKENNVTLLCLPSHTTHALQPLDRAFFRPLKVYFTQEAKSWMIMNKDKRLTRYDVSKLIGKAWGKAASVSNGIAALKSCGIYPYDPNAIPEHYFSLSDTLREHDLIDINQGNSNVNELGASYSKVHNIDNYRAGTEPTASAVAITEKHMGPESESTYNKENMITDNVVQVTVPASEKTPQKGRELHSEFIVETPTKVLTNIHPIPKLPAMVLKKKQRALVLTSPENIQKRKAIEKRKKVVVTKTCEKNKVTKEGKKGKSRKKKMTISSSSSESDNDEENYKSPSNEDISDEENRCIECTENYYCTTSKEDWIKCSSCLSWMHEFCTMYNPLCNVCGKIAKRQAVNKPRKTKKK